MKTLKQPLPTKFERERHVRERNKSFTYTIIVIATLIGGTLIELSHWGVL